ncbi:hypothetical protein [Streptomyces sp. NPDC057702]|uniref:hypothetical protein n=1 Tax=unclassified Streptomyces TaxID=2593676 RepID=UPI0036ACFF24
MDRQTWVHLLVWRPVDPADPLDVSRSWPRVLQVVRDGVASPPGVVLRPGEALPAAAARVADALGLRPPPEPLRLLALDQRPPENGQAEQVDLVFDGGWLATDDLPPCDDCGQGHTAWTPMREVSRVALIHAFRSLLTGEHTSALLWRGDLPDES